MIRCSIMLALLLGIGVAAYRQVKAMKGASEKARQETYAALQRGGNGSRGSSGGRRGRTTPNRNEYPMWEIDPRFSKDVFTFARARYSSDGSYGGWANDFPDCDWNFSTRLQQLTSLEVDPNGVVLDLDDPNLLDYPFLYMSNVGGMSLNQNEAEALGNYLLCGGFLMADDFWAPAGWENAKREMQRVLPGCEPQELTRDHEIFHLVYDLKTKPQVPSIRAWERGHTFEYWHGDPQGDEGPHFWAYFDDADRMVALMCHNNDIGDGWEREGDNKQYFEEYSVRVSYPLGINIVTYALTQ